MDNSPLLVYATCDLGAAALQRVRAAGIELSVYPRPQPPPSGVIREQLARRRVQGLLTTLRDPIDAALLGAGAGTLRVVAQCAVGLDNVDVEAATRLGIVVTHTPDVLTPATAEFALFSLGSLARGLEPSETLVREGGWRQWHPFLPFLGTEVHGMTVGVIGLGRIGRAFAARCVGLEVDLLLHDPHHEDADLVHALQQQMDLRLTSGLTSEQHWARFVDKRTLLNEADAVSVHVPLRESTRHLIDAEALEWMKPTAFLVNTSRGPVVDENAVAVAITEDRLGGAALDVFATEPLPPNSPLLDPLLRPRLRLFHHFASGTSRTRLDPHPDVGMAGRAVAGLLAVLAPEPGQDPRKLSYVVNPEVLGRRELHPGPGRQS